jgi:uncharacterized membrane protein
MKQAPLIAALLVIATACGAATTPAAPPASPVAKPVARCDGTLPTYAGDVRPILERRCFACHAGDGPAAEEHDFTRVEALRAQRPLLVDAVTQRAMPPAGRPQLSDAEAEMLVRWAACGGK